MWFKNLQIYRFTRPFELTAEQLEKELASQPYAPCGSQEQSKFGWVPPLGRQAEALVHAGNGQLLLCAKKEIRDIPAAVVADEVAEKVEALEAEQGRALRKKEKDAIKEDVIVALLPRAFSRFQQTFAWINPKAGFIAVDASSARRAEDLLALLRKCIGSLPVVPLSMTTPPELTMTNWLKEGAAPAGFNFGDEAELNSVLAHGGVVKVKRQDLLGDEMKAHLDADKMATSLDLGWGDTLDFVLKDDMSIRRLKFAEELRGQNDDITSEEPMARIDADFTLVTGELTRFIQELIAAMGGEEGQEEQAA